MERIWQLDALLVFLVSYMPLVFISGAPEGKLGSSAEAADPLTYVLRATDPPPIDYSASLSSLRL